MVSQKAISKRLIGTLKMPAKPHPGLSGQPAFLSLIGDRLREHGTCWIVAEETISLARQRLLHIREGIA